MKVADAFGQVRLSKTALDNSVHLQQSVFVVQVEKNRQKTLDIFLLILHTKAKVYLELMPSSCKDI